MDEQALLDGIVYPAQIVARRTAGYVNVAISYEADDTDDAELIAAEIGFGPHEVLSAERVEGLFVVTVRVFFVTDEDPS